MSISKEYNLIISQDTEGVYPFQQSRSDIIEDQISQYYVTSGSTGYVTPTINLSVSKIVNNLSNEFQSIEESSQKHLFLQLLLSIHNILVKYYQLYEFSHLPPIHVIIVEDESILVEWVFLYFRIGFSIEKEIDKSNWYLLSNSNLDNITNSGLIDSNNLDALIDALIAFIVKNT